MNAQSAKSLAVLAVYVANNSAKTLDNSPTRIVDALEKANKYALQLHAIFERQCDGYPVFAAKLEARDEKKEARLIAKIKDLCIGLGFQTVHIQSDPRGMPVQLSFDVIEKPCSASYSHFLGF
jgi:hypothetical protein